MTEMRAHLGGAQRLSAARGLGHPEAGFGSARRRRTAARPDRLPRAVPWGAQGPPCALRFTPACRVCHSARVGRAWYSLRTANAARRVAGVACAVRGLLGHRVSRQAPREHMNTAERSPTQQDRAGRPDSQWRRLLCRRRGARVLGAARQRRQRSCWLASPCTSGLTARGRVAAARLHPAGVSRATRRASKRSRHVRQAPDHAAFSAHPATAARSAARCRRRATRHR